MIGEVMAIVSALTAICISAWALIVACGLLFPARAELARSILVSKPKACLALGVGVVVILGFISVALLNGHLPGMKLLGMVGILTILGCGAVGATALSFVAADRLQDMAPGLPPYAVFIRAAGFVVAGSVFPILGWFAFAPLAFCAAVGCGWKAVMGRLSLSVQHKAESGV
jgi:hypothetical protein